MERCVLLTLGNKSTAPIAPGVPGQASQWICMAPLPSAQERPQCWTTAGKRGLFPFKYEFEGHSNTPKFRYIWDETQVIALRFSRLLCRFKCEDEFYWSNEVLQLQNAWLSQDIPKRNSDVGQPSTKTGASRWLFDWWPPFKGQNVFQFSSHSLHHGHSSKRPSSLERWQHTWSLREHWGGYRPIKRAS